MSRRRNGTFEALAELPWWVSICLGVAAYMGVTLISQLFTSEIILCNVWAAGLFLLPAGLSALRSYRKRQLLDRQCGIESVQALSWKEFEMLLGEAYRRQGYAVRENAYAGPDGGIDLTLERNGNVYLVQCKHWQAQKVGVQVVREMLGLVTAHAAQGAIIVTSGTFTQEAKAFAARQPIALIEGQQLVQMVRSVQVTPPAATNPAAPQPQGALRATTPATAQRICPRCAGNMVVRVARRGPNAGIPFWGCTSYPKCRHTEAYEG
ncbi:MAG: restriction endonuclease [Anaerolineae bacterium]